MIATGGGRAEFEGGGMSVRNSGSSPTQLHPLSLKRLQFENERILQLPPEEYIWLPTRLAITLHAGRRHFLNKESFFTANANAGGRSERNNGWKGGRSKRDDEGEFGGTL